MCLFLTERRDPHAPEIQLEGFPWKQKAHFLLHLLEEAPSNSASEAAAFQPGGYSYSCVNPWAGRALSTIPCWTDSLSTLCPYLVPQSWRSTLHWGHIPSLRGFSLLGCGLCSFLVDVLSLLPDAFEKASHSQTYSHNTLTLSAWSYAGGARHPGRGGHPLIFCPRTDVILVSCCWLFLQRGLL